MKKRCVRGQPVYIGHYIVPFMRCEIRQWEFQSKQSDGTISGVVLCDGKEVGRWTATVEYPVVEKIIKHDDIHNPSREFDDD